MMQDALQEREKDTSEVRTVEINESSLTSLQAAHVIPTQSNFGSDMSGSDDDEASEVSCGEINWIKVWM